MLDEHLITYLTAAQVRKRYGGVSDMALWRWLRDERLGFPQPLRIQSRRFWRLTDLVAWECAQTAESPPVDLEPSAESGAAASPGERTEESTQHAETQLEPKPWGAGAALADLQDRSRGGRA
jgi:hypothetical protein